jgi:Leucine-rich repeat (LRR) protein
MENMFNRTGAERLTELKLDNNQLMSLPAHIFDPLFGLTYLNLSHNQLQVLEVSLFAQLRHLQFLDMKGNQLSTLPVELFAFQNELISLDLGDNRFSTLDVKVMTALTKLTSLNISGNPLNCDCNLQPVVIWNSPIRQYIDAKCHFPSQYKDRSWYELTNVTCTSPPSIGTITPSTDTTPGFEIHRSTSVTRKYTAVSSPNNKQPGNWGPDINLYPVSIALIVILIILSLVLIGVMVFISWYKRMNR